MNQDNTHPVSRLNPGTGTSRIAAYDGLRGVAVLLVILGHGWICFYSPTYPDWDLVGAIIGNAGFGVRLFFVLSGFLITSLLLTEESRFGNISLRNFYARRVLRIFPAFYAMILFLIVLNHCGLIVITPKQFVVAGAFAWNYQTLIPGQFAGGSTEGIWFLGHTWTLAIEEQFYIIWPGLFVYLPRRRLKTFLVCSIIAMPVFRVAGYLLFPLQRSAVTMMFHTASDGLLIGCLLALMQQQISQTRLVSLVSKPSLVVVLLCISLLVSPILARWLGGIWVVPFGMTVDSAAAGAIIYAISNPNYQLVGTRILERGLLPWLGRMSYGVYLWQQVFINPFSKCWSQSFFFSCIFTLIAASASYYLMELPILRLKRYFHRN